MRMARPARMLWNGAAERRFDIGVEAPHGSPAFGLALRPSTIAAIVEVNATIRITVYPGSEAQPNYKKRRQKQL